jgi:hypothetical protein
MAITWNNTIKQQFKPFDINHMRQVTGGDIDLSSLASVKANADRIFEMVSTQQMPPGNPWSDELVQNFKAWMDDGMPEDDAAGDGTVGSGGASITWNNTIKDQFKPFDISHMKQVTGGDIDLSSFASVKANADGILEVVSNQRMPPGNPWSDELVQSFKTWMDNGMPEGDAGGGTVGGGGASITWNNTIKNQFKPLDINHMKQVTGGDIDLGSFASVKANADRIFEMVSTQQMPPGNPWSDLLVQNFKTWMDTGFPEG